MTSAWPGISPGRITHTADRVLSITALSRCLCMLPQVAMESNATIFETFSLLRVNHLCLYFGFRTSVLFSKGTELLFAFRK